MAKKKPTTESVSSLLNDVLKYLIEQSKSKDRDELIVRIAEAVVQQDPPSSKEMSREESCKGGYACYRG